MIRRFNYTRRRRIRRQDVRVSVRSNGDTLPIFSADLSLDRYSLPGEARVFVEAYRQTSFMRFPWGRVGQLAPAVDRTLTEFGTADGVLFRVKIVEPLDNGNGRPARLLALANQISPKRLDQARLQSLSLLAVTLADLEEVWRVDFSPDGGEPTLQVNQRLVRSHHALVRSQEFVSLALPQVFRAILTQVLMIDRFDAIEDEADWHSLWLRFSQTLPGVGEAPQPACGDRGELENADELERWIDDAVAAFARKFRVDRRFSDWWSDGEDV